jgi:hypothetical protein
MLDPCKSSGRPQWVVAYWLGSDREAFVIAESGTILGTYFIRPNKVAVAGASVVVAQRPRRANSGR